MSEVHRFDLTRLAGALKHLGANSRPRDELNAHQGNATEYMVIARIVGLADEIK